ncbi:MAG: peptide chain release factor 2 [Candidatus Yanofskybacteria bacterium CG10_big_fil_rev_8_21_14_0_10_36_16]|uniref:Peptide chain release factor 2 n=1 Tax=Candidatus Yanofskybacteria bacterium CG10_big_fil_rev_8_21_14_0_10_36_16 TaxID=1975096 RepID=A0A2J0Q736_9BACT|nr:MAG: peptide chain release factor 2 [Candidatus Yanofskybacteria bacterium CG10_big_fil_rev_8_21_14_0_10_36_16]
MSENTLRQKIEDIKYRFRASRMSDIDGISTRIDDIELEMQSPDIWKDHQRAGKLSKELNELKEEYDFWRNLEGQLGEFLNLDDSQLEKKADEVKEFVVEFNRAYAKVFLSGKYDKGDALLYIYAGAGGVDAQDWAGMLLQMYRYYSENKGWDFYILDRSFGDQDGLKTAVVEVGGRYAYGYLKGEAGVHRLVRISPFSAKKLRHTSFALVDVLPVMDSAKINIDPKDLRIETFRSSGPGGQNVNKVETAVRITHEPTGISVAVQAGRSQAQNKEKAMQLLASKLNKIMEETKVKELGELSKASSTEIEWGSQIRSYVLNPYKLVKDHRTGIESHKPEEVLEGNLDEFVEAEIQKTE